MLKIDSHTHILPGTLPRWTEKFGYGNFIHLEPGRPGFARMMQGDRFFREIARTAGTNTSASPNTPPTPPKSKSCAPSRSCSATMQNRTMRWKSGSS